jgi:hypothetical protein
MLVEIRLLSGSMHPPNAAPRQMWPAFSPSVTAHVSSSGIQLV